MHCKSASIGRECTLQEEAYLKERHIRRAHCKRVHLGEKCTGRVKSALQEYTPRREAYWESEKCTIAACKDNLRIDQTNMQIKHITQYR